MFSKDCLIYLSFYVIIIIIIISSPLSGHRKELVLFLFSVRISLFFHMYEVVVTYLQIWSTYILLSDLCLEEEFTLHLFTGLLAVHIFTWYFSVVTEWKPQAWKAPVPEIPYFVFKS